MTHPSHHYFDDPAMTRLMGMVTALAGEVFVLKAQNRRLTVALEDAGSLDPETLSAAGDSPDLAIWMEQERDAFAAALMAPLTEPDMAQAAHDRIFGTGTIGDKVAHATGKSRATGKGDAI